MIFDRQDGRAAINQIRDALSDVMLEFGAPRDPAWAGQYLVSTLPAGRFVIYGAGTQSEALIAALDVRPDVEIVGFVDRRATVLGSFQGRPVFPPERVSEFTCDGVIVSHLRHERSMIEKLFAVGVRSDQIFPIYTNMDFARWSAARFSNRLAEIQTDRIRYLVITCAESTWSLLTNRELATILPPSETLHLYFGRAESLEIDDPEAAFIVFDIKQSLQGLEAIIAATDPVSVYVKSSVYHYGQFLGAYLKIRYPRLIVVQEMYDQALLLTDHKLAYGYDYDETERALLRAAERASFDCCDLVVTKNGGEAWAKLAEPFLAPWVTYFPRVTAQVAPPCVANGDEVCRIVFAGTLPRPEAYDKGSDQLDMCYTEMIERMSPDRRYQIDLYNGAHRYPGHDETFAAYRKRYPVDGVIRYFSAVSLLELRDLLCRYDYGWHVMHESLGTVEPVSRVGIGNKFTTYLQAGLPVVIDTGFEYMARLISTFGAGLVVGPENMVRLHDHLLEFDGVKFRPGVEALLAYMCQVNRSSIERVRVVMLGKHNNP